MSEAKFSLCLHPTGSREGRWSASFHWNISCPQSFSRNISSWIFTTLTFWTLSEWNMSENLSVSLEAITDHSKKIVKYKRLSFVQSNLLSLMKSVFPLQVYKVVVNFGEESWFIFRRYNEFHSLHEKVSSFILLGGGGSIHITCINLRFFYMKS